MVIVAAPMSYAHLFGHGDGDVIHVTPVPNRLEEWIGEAERQDVLYRLLAQVMVDAENLGFVEIFPESTIHLSCRIQIMTDRFFHNDAVPHLIPIQSRIG